MSGRVRRSNGGRRLARPSTNVVRRSCPTSWLSPPVTNVDFPNSDETYHNVFSLSPVEPFDLGRYAAGRSKSVRFDQPGIVRVFCDIHSHMSAWVLVFGHRFFAITNEDGSYRIDGVPPGTYNVLVWHELFGSDSRSIRVNGSGEDVELNFSLQ